MGIVCQWVFCFIIAKGTQQCGRVSSGTREELAGAITKMDGTPGDMLVSECVKKGEKYVLDWSKK